MKVGDLTACLSDNIHYIITVFQWNNMDARDLVAASRDSGTQLHQRLERVVVAKGHSQRLFLQDASGYGRPLPM
jgi:hypothetical protein